MKEAFGLGANSIHPTFRGVKETVEIRNRIQKYVVEKTRLGIPVLFVDEGQHGLMRPESTVFPQAIGLACSWNPELFEKVYSVIARRSAQVDTMCFPGHRRMPRSQMGRVEETYVRIRI